MTTPLCTHGAIVVHTAGSGEIRVVDQDLESRVTSTVPPEAYCRTRLRDPTELDMDRMIERLRARSRNSWQVDDNAAIDLNVIAETGLMARHDRPEEFDRIFLRTLGGRAAEEDRR